MNLSLADIYALAPLLILLKGALLLLLLESFFPDFSSRFAAFVAFIAISAASLSVLCAVTSSNVLLTSWLNFDSFAQSFSLFFLAIGLATTLLSASFFEKFPASKGEYFFLLLSSLIGLILIAQAADFLVLFLGIESLSITLYILCGYMKSWHKSHEAAFKYFLMGSIASAFLVYGIALIYGALGTTRFDALLPGLEHLTASSEKTLFFMGISFVTLSLAFKAAIVPFHLWAPDVYAGSPTPVTAFMAVGTKIGVFAAFMRLFLGVLPEFDSRFNIGIAILAAITLIYANIVAIRQSYLRRFFAYSGMSHAGFLLLAIAAGGPFAQSAMFYYLLIYSLATFACFAIITQMEQSEEGLSIQDLRGLFYEDPISAVILTIGFLTLAGIPPSAGFFAKFQLFKIAYSAGYLGLVIVALATTVLAAFYYLRIVSMIFASGAGKNTFAFSQAARLLGILAALSLCLLAIWPTFTPDSFHQIANTRLHLP